MSRRFRKAMSSLGITEKTKKQYVTSDGCSFDTCKKAEEWETHIVFSALGKQYKLYSDHLYNDHDIVEYIFKNRRKIELIFAQLDSIEQSHITVELLARS